jgi:uncharacterized protein YdaU (DUF1376 family)
MTSTPTTWMPIDIGDYLADTMSLSAEDHGAYLLLTFAYWKNRGPLPDDKKELQATAKISEKKTYRLLAKYFRLQDGFWHHKRIDKELLKALSQKEKKAKQTEPARLAKLAKTNSVTETVTEPVTDLRAGTPLPLPLPKKETNHRQSTTSAPDKKDDDDLVKIFDEELEKIFGKARAAPTTDDKTRSKQYRTQGITPEEFRIICQTVMNRARDGGHEPPGGLIYLASEITRQTASVKKPESDREKAQRFAKQMANIEKYRANGDTSRLELWQRGWTADSAQFLADYEAKHGKVQL